MHIYFLTMKEDGVWKNKQKKNTEEYMDTYKTKYLLEL